MRGILIRNGRRSGSDSRQTDGSYRWEDNPRATSLGVGAIAAGISRVDSTLGAIGTESHRAITVTAVVGLVCDTLDAVLTI